MVINKYDLEKTEGVTILKGGVYFSEEIPRLYDMGDLYSETIEVYEDEYIIIPKFEHIHIFKTKPTRLNWTESDGMHSTTKRIPINGDKKGYIYILED